MSEVSQPLTDGSTASDAHDTLALNVQDQAGKRGRPSKFTAHEDLIILREVADAKDHIAWHGRKMDVFQPTAQAAYTKEDFNADGITAKIIKDRYECLEKQFEERDRREQPVSGIEWEVREPDELLMMMKEARDYLAEKGRKERDAARVREKKKVQAGSV